METSELQSENKKFACPYCLKKFNKIIDLKRHITKSHLLYGIYCPFCIEFYGTIAKLQSHLVMTNDKFHRNLYYLITKGYLRKVDKKLLM